MEVGYIGSWHYEALGFQEESICESDHEVMDLDGVLNGKVGIELFNWRCLIVATPLVAFPLFVALGDRM